jgi:hypothetical protein
MQEFGNRRAAMIWEATLPEGFRRPSASDGYTLEKFIRAKYVSKQFYKDKTKEQLDRQELEQPAAPVEYVQPAAPIEESQQHVSRLSGSVPRRPIRRPAGHTFSPPNSPPPQSPPATDFGPFQKNPLPPVELLSTAVNLLSLEADTPDFGQFTPPAVPKNEHPIQTPLPGVQAPPPSPAVPQVGQTLQQQAAKDSIMGMFEPAPAVSAYNYGYPATTATAGYPPSPQPTYNYGYATAQVYSPSQVYTSPVGSPGAYYQQQQYAYPQPTSPTPTQWGGYGAGGVDPLLHKIQVISQEKRDGTQGSGLATLLI